MRKAAWGAALALWAAPLARGATVTSTWNSNPGPAGTNWTDVARWSNSPAANTYPNNGNLSNVYDVVLNGPVSPTLNVNVTLRSLTLNGGTIATTATAPAAGTNGISVTNGFRWSGGYFQVPITVPSGATFTIDTSTGVAMGFGGTLTLGGTATFTGTNAATIQANRHDTRFNITSTGALTLDRQLKLSLPPITDPWTDLSTRPSGTLNNAGLITLAGGASLQNVSPFPFYNTGTVRVTGASAIGMGTDSSGLIDLSSASSALTFNPPVPNGVDNTFLSGAVKLAAGSTLTFANGGTVLNGPSVTNAGTINIQSDLRVAAATTIPGTVNFTSNSAWMTLAAPLTLTGRAVFSNGGGGPQVFGPGRLTAYDFKPQGITFVGSELYIPATRSLDMGDNSSMGLGGGRLTLEGTATWGRLGGGVYAQGTGVARVDVRAGALVDVRPSATASFPTRSSTTGPAADALTNAGTIQVDRASLVVGQNWAFDNSGTVRVMPGSSVTLSSALSTNSGTIDLQAGTSLLANGGAYNSAAVAMGLGFRNDSTGVIRVAQAATATFSSYGSGPLTNAGLVEVNGGRVTVDRILFANSGTLTVSSGTAQLGGLALSNTGTIGVGATTLQVTANAVTNTGRIDLGGGSTMTVAIPSGSGAGAFRNDAGGVLKVGPGSVATFAPTSSKLFANAGAVEVDHGRLTLTDDWGFSNSGSVVVTSGVMRASLRSFTNAGGIDLRAGGGAVLANTAAVDAALNLQRVRDMVVSGYHAGAWDGVGIRSASAATDPTTAVGYGPAKTSGTFLGVSVVANDVLIRHTKYGDATLDGVVNFDDLLALAKAYNSKAAHWYQGDFSYDGAVDFDDLLALAKNYGAAMPAAGAVPGASAEFSADLAAAFAQAAVPEPSGGVLFGAIAATIAAGRRRRRRQSRV